MEPHCISKMKMDKLLVIKNFKEIAEFLESKMVFNVSCYIHAPLSYGCSTPRKLEEHEKKKTKKHRSCLRP